MGGDEPRVIDTSGARWCRMRPAPDEARVAKRGYSGFLGTGLADRLPRRGLRPADCRGPGRRVLCTGDRADRYPAGDHEIIVLRVLAPRSDDEPNLLAWHRHEIKILSYSPVDRPPRKRPTHPAAPRLTPRG